MLRPHTNTFTPETNLTTAAHNVLPDVLVPMNTKMCITDVVRDVLTDAVTHANTDMNVTTVSRFDLPDALVPTNTKMRITDAAFVVPLDAEVPTSYPKMCKKFTPVRILPPTPPSMSRRILRCP
jgi:hypothetical protein